jgi:hypothetical protein
MAVPGAVPGAAVSGGEGMFWVFLEVVAALAIAIGIVWWTMPRKPKAGPPAAKEDRKEEPRP